MTTQLLRELSAKAAVLDGEPRGPSLVKSADAGAMLRPPGYSLSDRRASSMAEACRAYGPGRVLGLMRASTSAS